MDFQTTFRQHGYKFVTPEVKQPAHSFRDVYHERAPHVFSTPRVQVHDCRPEVMQEFSDPHLWEAWLLKQRLDATCRDATKLHEKERIENPGGSGNKEPDKLLFNVGVRGGSKGDFNFPRGLAVSDSGDIWVADTMNHRVQQFNQFGVIKACWGMRGSKPGQLDQPTGVSILFNDDIAVADRKNKRVQVFNQEGKFKHGFNTRQEPFSITSDDEDNIVVGTFAHSVEVYKGGKLFNTFNLGSAREKSASWVACSNKEEVVVSDPLSGTIRFYTYGGRLLYQFKPVCLGTGLSCVPGGVCLNPLGQVLVADAMNHTVNLYSERGVLLLQLIGPTDDTGAVQTCAVGPEGHLVVTEFTANGPHCLKIFRYRECECHRTRPGSSKKRPSKQDSKQ